MAPDQNEYFRQLYDRLGTALKVPFREVSFGEWKPAPNKCHDNVDYWVRHHPGCRAVRGWIFWPAGGEGRNRFLAHSMVEDEGDLFDITPMDRNARESLLFLRHFGSDAEFDPMKTDCAHVLYPPFTQEEWHENQAAPETDEEAEMDF